MGIGASLCGHSWLCSPLAQIPVPWLSLWHYTEVKAQGFGAAQCLGLQGLLYL